MAHEGWESEIFVEPPSESDLCGICCEVLEDAVETPCGHAFCEKCIKNWLTQRQVCPQDQSAISLNDCHPMVRDRRRILGMKVKCGWCEEQMELREYKVHRHRKCKSRPDDYEPTPTPPAEPLDASGHASIRGSVHEAKEQKEEQKEQKGEYALELFADDGEQKARERQEREEKDRRFALEMEARSRLEAAQRRTPRAQSPQNQLGEAHVDEIGEAQVVFEPVEDENGIEDEAEGQPDPRLVKRKRPQSGCCGCSDKIWCCLCCFIWLLILVGGLVYWKFGSSSLSYVHL